MKLECPLYILLGHETCWRCRKKTKVYGFAAQKGDTFRTLPFIISVPDPLKAIFDKKNIRYKYSKSFGGKYFMNCCHHCQAIQGDNYLYIFSNGCFYNYTETQAINEGYIIKRNGFVEIGLEKVAPNNPEKPYSAIMDKLSSLHIFKD